MPMRQGEDGAVNWHWSLTCMGPVSETIHCLRLDLVPLTPDLLRCFLRREMRAPPSEFRFAPPEGWPGEDVDVLALRLQQLEEDPSLQPWLLRAMVLRQTGEMVGHIGFHTAPDAAYLRDFSPMGVEFGYTVFPSFRRHGFAREAATGLMKWAQSSYGVNLFVVSIAPSNTASQALAAGLGFRKIGSHLDEIDGVEDVLECDLAPPKF